MLGAQFKDNIRTPAKSEKPAENEKVDSVVDESVNGTHCHICSIHCQNMFNLQAHLDGKNHKKQSNMLFKTLIGNRHETEWGDLAVKSVRANRLEPGDLVLVLDEGQALATQGTVVGHTERRRMVHIAITRQSERIYEGGEYVHKVEVKDPPNWRASSGTPSRKHPRRRAATPSTGKAKSRKKKKKKKKKGEKKDNKNKGVDEPISLTPELNTKRNVEKLAERRTRDQAPEEKKARARDHYCEGYWLSNKDLEWAINATHAHDAVIYPTGHDKLIEILIQMVEDNRFGEWVVGIVNTDKHSGDGVHWLLGLWCITKHPEGGLKTQVIIWDPLMSAKYSEHIKRELEQYDPLNATVAVVAAKVQRNGWSCGYITLYWYGEVARLIRQGVFIPQDYTPEMYAQEDSWE